MTQVRWSVRHVDEEAIACLREVKETNGGTFGQLLSEAVLSWYESLDEEVPEVSFPLTDSQRAIETLSRALGVEPSTLEGAD